MSRISGPRLDGAVKEILHHSNQKKRNFIETIDLQICLKNVNPRVDKRFSGATVLENKCKKRMTCCVYGNQADCDRAKEIGVDYMSIDDLKALNKNKKVIKKLGKKYDFFLASASLIRLIPRVLGPTLGKMGNFPSILKPDDDMREAIDQRERTVKFRLKKTPQLNVAIGHVELEKEEIAQNVQKSLNFLATLTKRGWNNIGNVYIKSTMGPPYQIL